MAMAFARDLEEMKDSILGKLSEVEGNIMGKLDEVQGKTIKREEEQGEQKEEQGEEKEEPGEKGMWNKVAETQIPEGITSLDDIGIPGAIMRTFEGEGRTLA